MNFTIVDGQNQFRGEAVELVEAMAIAEAQPESQLFLGALGPIFILHKHLQTEEGRPVIAAIYCAGQILKGEGQILPEYVDGSIKGFRIILPATNKGVIEVPTGNKFTPEDIAEFEEQLRQKPYLDYYGQPNAILADGENGPILSTDGEEDFNASPQVVGDELPFNEYPEDGCPDCQTGIYAPEADGPIDQTEIIEMIRRNFQTPKK